MSRARAVSAIGSVCGLVLLYSALAAQTVDTMWVRNFDAGNNQADRLSEIAAGRDGRVVAFGTGNRSGSFDDLWTVVCDQWGRRQWEAWYDGSSHDNDSGVAVALDSAGSVYALGTTRENGNLSITLVKYRADSTRAWVRSLNFPGDLEAGAVDLAVSDSGAVYACGFRRRALADYDFVLIRYAPATGETLWTRSYSRPGENNDDAPMAMAIDRDGSVVVTGYSYAAFSGLDYCTLKYAPDGTELWRNYYDRFGATGHQDDIPQAVAVDRTGAVIVTGQSYDDNTDFDFATVKYTAAGDSGWIRRYNRAPENGEDIALAIAVDDSDNVFVAGTSYDSSLDYDYVTIKYAPDGSPRWIDRYDGSAGEDVATSLARDRDGALYVTGWSFAPGTDNDILTLKYPAGQSVPVWAHRYDGPLHDNDEAQKVVAGAAPGVFVGAQSMTADRDVDYCLMRLYEPTHDCGTSLIVFPPDTVVIGDTIIPQVVVRNYGLYPETLMVRFALDTTYQDSVRWYLEPGPGEMVSFRPWVAATVGSFAMVCSTGLAGDVNPLNDACRDSVRVNAHSGSAERKRTVSRELAITAAPNPASGQVCIRYACPPAEPARIRLYSVAGRAVKTLASRQAGTGALRFCPADLPAGVYVLRLETAHRSTGVRLTITR